MRCIKGLYCRCHDCQGARWFGGRPGKKRGWRGARIKRLNRAIRREGKRGMHPEPKSLPCG